MRNPTKAQRELLAYLARGYQLGRLDEFHVLRVTDERGRCWLKVGAIWPSTIAAVKQAGWVDERNRLTDAGLEVAG